MKIGLLTSVTVRSHIGMGMSYVNFCTEIAKKCGEKLDLVLLTHTNDVRDDLDLFILPGGADVDPQLYSDEVDFAVGRTDPQRDYFTSNKLPGYIDNGTPIFGICRGMQEIAAHFGMDLIQHKVEPLSKYEFGETCEKVTLMNYFKVHNYKPKKEDGTPNWEMLKGEKVRHTLEINSRHHQSLKACDPKLATVTAHIENDPDRIEAIEYLNYNIITVQWHPELLWDQYSMDSAVKLYKSKKKELIAESQ